MRGKARASVEFGAKISVSTQNGFPFLHRISWDAYNEGEDLIAQAEQYKLDTGSYPERICADRIYITAANRHYCTRNGIRLSGKRLGRPPKDAGITAARKEKLRADQSRRNEVEGVFGSGKRKYSLDLIMARLKAEGWSRNSDFYGLPGDVCREGPEAPAPLFCPSITVVLWLGLALDIAKRVWRDSQAFFVKSHHFGISLDKGLEDTRLLPTIRGADSKIFFRSPYIVLDY